MYLEILILAVLITLNGFFAMAEIAVVSSKKSKLEKEARSGSKGAKTALKLLTKPEDFLSTVQIGITLIGIFAGAYGGIALAEDLVPFFQQFNSLKEYAFEISFILIVGVITYFSLIIGELVPKTIAFNNPEGIAAIVAPFLLLVSIITKPVVVLLSWSTRLLLKIFFIEPKSENSERCQEWLNGTVSKTVEGVMPSESSNLSLSESSNLSLSAEYRSRHVVILSGKTVEGVCLPRVLPKGFTYYQTKIIIVQFCSLSAAVLYLFC
jgi:putative hemolysin